ARTVGRQDRAAGSHGTLAPAVTGGQNRTQKRTTWCCPPRPTSPLLCAAVSLSSKRRSTLGSIAPNWPRKNLTQIHQVSFLKKSSEPVLFWPVGSYVVAYGPEPRLVPIVRVFHGARDLDALL